MASEQRNGKPSLRLSRLGETLVSTLRDYVVNLRWKGEEEGVTAVQRLMRRGPLYWPGLVVLAVAVLAATYLSLEGDRFPTASTSFVDQIVQIPRPTLYLSLLVTALGWAYLLVGAAATHLGLYVLVSCYVTYFGLYLSLGLESRTPWLVLVPLWLLAWGAWGASGHRTRWRLPFLFLLSLLAAQYSYVGLRLQMRLPPLWGLPFIVAIYFVLAANRWVARQRPIRPWLAFAVSLILFSSLYGATLWAAPPGQFSPYVVFVFGYLLYFLEIFWFWMGAQLIETARTLAGWTLGRIEAIVPRRVLARTLAALALGWNIGVLVLTYGYELEGTAAVAAPGWQGAMLQAYVSLKPSLALIEANQYHALINLALAIYVATLAAKKRYSDQKLLQLVGVSLLAFFVAYGYFGAFYSLSGASEVLSGLQPLLLFVALMLWEMIKTASDLAAGSGHRAGLLLGCLLIVASISLFELAADPAYFALLLTGTPFLGAIYLGLPYLLYTFLYEQRHYTPVPAQQLRLVFVLGMFSAIPALITGRIFLTPGLWLLILLATVWRWGRWETVWDGLTYVLATGLGFAVYYIYPLPVPIPTYTGWLNQLALLQLNYTGRRFLPWDPLCWQTMVGVLAAAVILGYSLYRARQSQGRRQAALLVIGALLSVALLAVWEYALAL